MTLTRSSLAEGMRERATGFVRSGGMSDSEKWVRVMADYAADGLWHRDGCSMSIDSLPVSRQIAWDLGAWQTMHDQHDEENEMDDRTRNWFAQFGLRIARAIKEELPDWTVIYFDAAKARYDDDQPRIEFEYEIIRQPVTQIMARPVNDKE